MGSSHRIRARAAEARRKGPQNTESVRVGGNSMENKTKTPEREPGVKYQLLYDPAKPNDSCFMIKEWTQAQLDNWEEAGYRQQDGHYTELGLFDSEEEVKAEKNRIRRPEEGDPTQEFARILATKGEELRAYKGVEANGYTYVNRDGAEAGIGVEGNKWISFTYYDMNNSTGQEEIFHGAVNPENGEVIATGSEIQHWFE